MPISEGLETDFQKIDMNSIDQLENKTIGGEWLVKQVFNKLRLSDLFSGIGMSENETGLLKC